MIPALIFMISIFVIIFLLIWLIAMEIKDWKKDKQRQEEILKMLEMWEEEEIRVREFMELSLNDHRRNSGLDPL